MTDEVSDTVDQMALDAVEALGNNYPFQIIIQCADDLIDSVIRYLHCVLGLRYSDYTLFAQRIANEEYLITIRP